MKILLITLLVLFLLFVISFLLSLIFRAYIIGFTTCAFCGRRIIYIRKYKDMHYGVCKCGAQWMI